MFSGRFGFPTTKLSHMSSRRRHQSRGSSSRQSTSEPPLDDIISAAGYGHIDFQNDEQRKRFLALRNRPMSPTRFLDLEALEALGLKKEMKKLLKLSGCPGLFEMCEHTYRCITLEFLSSYYYDEEEPAVNFRLFGVDHCLYPEEWGNVIGCRSTGYIHLAEPRDGTNIMYTALTGLEREGGSGWKFRAHLIHHPVIRLWCRLVGNTLFARPEPTNMKLHDVHILFAALNVDRGERFKVNVAHHFAQHLQLVADGVIKPIMLGGVITHIAKAIFEHVEESALELVPGSPEGYPLTMDMGCISRMHYIRKIDENSWWWKVGNTLLVQLPEAGDFRKVNPVKRFHPGSDFDPSYYLMSPTVEHGRGSPSDGDEADELPQAGVNIIDPIGDYSQFRHYPFDEDPYRPKGYDPMRFPPTFATYPPFAEPQVWNQNSRDAMLMGLCNQMHQATLDQSLGAHNIYSYHVDQGHIPGTALHPHYYQRPLSPAPSDLRSERQSAASHASHADPEASSSHHTDRAGGNTDRYVDPFVTPNRIYPGPPSDDSTI